MKVEKTIQIHASAESVWNHLTDPNLTKQYFFGCEAISDWKEGSQIRYQTGQGDSVLVHVEGVIQKVDSPKYLETTCYAAGKATDTASHTIATYSLTEDAGSTTLAITQGPLADQQTVEQYATNWDMVLNGLKSLAESNS